MPVPLTFEKRMQAIEGLTLTRQAPLREMTRFAIGGPASLLVQAWSADAFRLALEETKAHGVPRLVIGGGTNLIVSDAGFDGVALRFEATCDSISPARNQARDQRGGGTSLQDLVDWTMNSGLSGMESLTGIPGSVGGAVYGNAGAYGRSTHELVRTVTYHRWTNNRALVQCRMPFLLPRKHLQGAEGLDNSSNGAATGKRRSCRTHQESNRDSDGPRPKYPPDMKCAGSIFKNLFFAHLPPSVQGLIPPALVREGKVPSAWFLEQIGARSMRVGDIEVAPYHANLISTSVTETVQPGCSD